MDQITLEIVLAHFDVYTTFVWVRDVLVEVVSETPGTDVEVKLHESTGAIRSAMLTAAVLNMRVGRPPASKEYDEAARVAHWRGMVDDTNDVKALMNFSRQHEFKPLHIHVDDIVLFGMQHEMSEYAIRRNEWQAEQERKAAGAKAAGAITDATTLTDAELWSVIANAEVQVGKARISSIKLKWLDVAMLVLKEANARGYTYDNLKAAFTGANQ